MDLFRILWTRSRPYAGYILAVLALQAASTAATLYLPSLNAKIIDRGIAQADIAYIWRTGGLMVAVAFVQVITAVIAVWFAAQTAMGLGRDLRAEVFDRVTRFSAADMAHFGTPTLITRATNDVGQVQMVYLLLLNFMVGAPIMCVGGIIMAIREDAGMSWLVAVSVAVLLGVLGALIIKLIPLFQSLQQRLDNINGTLREQIAGIRVIRAFVREDYETTRFDQDNTAITEVSLRVGRLFVLMFPAITLILNVATGAVLWFGGHRVDAGLMQVGSLTAFLQYLLQILVAVLMGTFVTMMAPRAIISAGRIMELLARQPSIPEPSNPQLPAGGSAGSPAGGSAGAAGVVEFSHVSFTYPGAEAPVLADVSFTAAPGTTTAIIGATGAGKSTVLALIPRLYVATSGNVRLDGVNVQDMARGEIVSRVSIVPQKPYLFSGTVASNLRLGNPTASDEELWAALRVAQAGFVESLDMPISQGGTNISGGQRQRLSIARLLVADPPVYLFDDSFSALDTVTDAAVRAGIKTALAERELQRTVIIVAQRVSSIQDADQILVMEAGQIVARGTHEQLLQSSQTYQEIVASQAVGA